MDRVDEAPKMEKWAERAALERAQWVQILGVDTFGRKGNVPTLPQMYPRVSTFRNVTFYTTDPWVLQFR